MNNKKKIIFIVITITAFILASITVSKMKDKKDTVIANSSIELSNKKIGWGIKRADNHEQPDLGSLNKKLLEQYNGIAMGNKNDKFVYLTFDEGYEAGYTERILNTLKENDVKACFFLTAYYVNKEESIVNRMIEEGHTIGNHTVNHKSMPDLTDEEIKNEIMKLHTAVYEKFEYEMKYIRPPKGEFSQRTLALTNNLGYKTVMWSLAYDDWNEDNQKGEVYAKDKILNNIHPGCIILLHGNSKDNTNVLDSVIKEIKSMGYEFKTLDEFTK